MGKKVLVPRNQKSVYASYNDLFGRIMNGEIDIDTAKYALKALDGSIKVFATEVKLAEISQQAIRNVESSSFEEEKR